MSKLTLYHRNNYLQIPQVQSLSGQEREAIGIVSQVFPFKTNSHVIEELIDWSQGSADPIFRMSFPHKDMLSDQDYRALQALMQRQAPPQELAETVNRIRRQLNPDQAQQAAHNIPSLHGLPLAGMQHKYRETLLFFPALGQSCHAWCTFCFRWPQFVSGSRRFAAADSQQLIAYLMEHPHITDLLFTGGDPLSLTAEQLKGYLEPLLSPALASVKNIRLGSRSLAWWPERFVTDPDASDLLRLLEKVVKGGKSLNLVAHFTHPRELLNNKTQQAMQLILATGTQIRAQCALLRGINDRSELLEQLWQLEVLHGCTPYYLFVARDTGAKICFEVSLWQAWQIFRQAYSHVSGLERSVRGPVMSCTPGKVCLDGPIEVAGQRAWSLRYIQARDASLVDRPFLAQFDPQATWWEQLKPFSLADEPFFANSFPPLT